MRWILVFAFSSNKGIKKTCLDFVKEKVSNLHSNPQQIRRLLSLQGCDISAEQDTTAVLLMVWSSFSSTAAWSNPQWLQQNMIWTQICTQQLWKNLMVPRSDDLLEFQLRLVAGSRKAG